MSPDALRTIKAVLPNDVGRTINEFGVIKILVRTTHAAATLPADFAGCLIGLRSFTNTVVVAASKNSNAEVDSGLAATAAGVSTKAGLSVTSGTLIPFRLPQWDPSETMYLITESQVDNTTLEVCRLDATAK